MQRNVIHNHYLFVHHKGMLRTIFICTKECCTQYTTKECCTQYLFGQRNVLHNICTKERCTNYLYKGMLYTIFVQRNVVHTICTKEYLSHYLYKLECCTQYLFVQRNIVHTICTKACCTQYFSIENYIFCNKAWVLQWSTLF